MGDNKIRYFCAPVTFETLPNLFGLQMGYAKSGQDTSGIPLRQFNSLMIVMLTVLPSDGVRQEQSGHEWYSPPSVQQCDDCDVDCSAFRWVTPRAVRTRVVFPSVSSAM